MSKSKSEPKIPFSLRLTSEEHAALNQAAGDTSMANYARSRLFGAETPLRKKRGLNPVKDREALGRVLGRLGASGVIDNLKQMTEAARGGYLTMDPATETVLLTACHEINLMRNDLMQALGLRVTDKSPSLTENFQTTAKQ